MNWLLLVMWPNVCRLFFFYSFVTANKKILDILWVKNVCFKNCMKQTGMYICKNESFIFFFAIVCFCFFPSAEFLHSGLHKIASFTLVLCNISSIHFIMYVSLSYSCCCVYYTLTTTHKYNHFFLCITVLSLKYLTP